MGMWCNCASLTRFTDDPLASENAVDTGRIEPTRIMTTDRIFQGEDQQWYFNVRGNQAVGPFASAQLASDALTRHVRTCQRRIEFAVPWPREWRPSRLLRRAASPARHV